MSNLVAGHPPDKWMTGMVEEDNGKRKQWPVTKFIYPGSHDACTWGEGVFALNWKCQQWPLYDQMAKYGQRYFDIRIKPGSNGSLWPFHGDASETADPFTDAQGNVNDQTLLGAIKRFANESPGEIIILSFNLDTDDVQWQKKFNDQVMQHIGSRLLPPGATTRPTYQEAISSQKNIILTIDKARIDQSTALAQCIWNQKDPNLFLGIGESRLYNDNTWQGYKVGDILSSIRGFITDKSAAIQQYQQFWCAQVQMTPVGASGVVKLPFKHSAEQIAPLMSPYYLALGRNFDGPLTWTTNGPPQPWPGSNYIVVFWETLNQDLWQKNTSCMTFDFAGMGENGYVNAFTDAIAYMNFLRD